MYRKISTPFLLILVALSGCSNSVSNRAKSDPSGDQVRAGISKAWSGHIEAAKRKDLPGVMAMYADDVVYSANQEAEVRGKTALEKLEQLGLKGAEVLDAKHTSHHVLVGDNASYEVGTVSGSLRPVGQEARTVTFNFMAMWQKQADGTWRLGYLVGR